MRGQQPIDSLCSLYRAPTQAAGIQARYPVSCPLLLPEGQSLVVRRDLMSPPDLENMIDILTNTSKEFLQNW